MKRTLAWTAVAVLCFSSGSSSLPAKPVAETPLAEALDKAPILCAARIVGHEFDDLKPGESRKTSQRFWLLIRYRVTEIMRDTSGKLQVGEVLSIRDKSNSCLAWEEEVTYQNKALRFSRRDKGPDGKETVVEEPVTVPVGRKVILLLGLDRIHYGWFASPQEDTGAIRSRIKAAPSP